MSHALDKLWRAQLDELIYLAKGDTETVAQMIGRDASNVRSWILGHTRPRLDSRKRIARVAEEATIIHEISL